MKMKKIDYDIYTDGACSGNPGPGGYAFIIIHDDGTWDEFGGYESKTTNNRMELTAVIKALEYIHSKNGTSRVRITTDSSYVVNAIQKGWLKNWVSHDYHKSDGSPLPNDDLWKKFVDIYKQHIVEFKWVKGHAGNKYNERCDRIAVGCIKGKITDYHTF